MARAAIELSSDISLYLPYLSQQVEGCAYNPETSQVAFRRDNMVVVIQPKEINIYKIENEASAKHLINWLKTILDNKEESVIED